MKIYIASSWKTEDVAKSIAFYLRGEGNEVDCFCDDSTGRYIFSWREFVDKEEDLNKYDAISFLDDPRSQRAFEEDKKWIDWSDVVVMVLPCGKSAHLEGGYAKGKGKKLYIYGEFRLGEFDVMYRFADGLFRSEELNLLADILRGS